VEELRKSSGLTSTSSNAVLPHVYQPVCSTDGAEETDMKVLYKVVHKTPKETSNNGFTLSYWDFRETWLLAHRCSITRVGVCLEYIG